MTPMTRPTSFERSRPGRRAFRLSPADYPTRPVHELLPAPLSRRAPLELPELSELDVVRHYTELSRHTFSIDRNFYPLGSCTMKYNPKINETVAAQAAFNRLHPYQDDEDAQGTLAMLHGLGELLQAVSGLAAVSLQPAAGAHGELTGLLVIRAALEAAGENRNVVLIPDQAHGTNPASCTVCGLKTRPLKSNARGHVDLDDLSRQLSHDDRVAALMITHPNTLGLFDPHIAEVVACVHAAGAKVYMDGANMNAILGKCRPGDFGVDVMHFNLHKTFSTPHGGGGPGAGPVAVTAELAPFLPEPRVVREGQRYRLQSGDPRSIGRVRSFFGSTGVLLRAYAYIRRHGPAELRDIAESAVLAANYVAARLKDAYEIPYPGPYMHEVVFSARRQKAQGVRALDIAKRLIDEGIHPPTIYFPLIVPEALMVEPTETESLETLDRFCDAMLMIAREAETDPERVHQAPQTTPVGRLDEVQAARRPVLTCSRLCPSD